MEDGQLEHAVKVARISSTENGLRDSALLLACFGTGMTVTELSRLRVHDYLKGELPGNLDWNFVRAACHVVVRGE